MSDFEDLHGMMLTKEEREVLYSILDSVDRDIYNDLIKLIKRQIELAQSKAS